MGTMKLWQSAVVTAGAERKHSPSGLAAAAPAVKTFLAPAGRALTLATVFVLLAFVPLAAHAQSGTAATQIKIGAPAQARLGQTLTVQAVLVDSRGNPISKEPIYFTAQMSFLNSSSDVVLAQAVTNNNGQAVAQITEDSSGTVSLKAEFRGDATYAASSATAPLAVDGSRQVYSEHVGVDIPGFNVPPVTTPVTTLQSSILSPLRALDGLWPAMNAWPIAAALILVWSMYFIAVTFIYRIAAPENPEPASIEGGQTDARH